MISKSGALRKDWAHICKKYVNCKYCKLEVC
jgi:hypothetical protein